MRMYVAITKALFLLLTLQSCAERPIVPPPEVRARFFEHAELMAPVERSPFALNWREDLSLIESLRQRCHQVYVAPVEIQFLEQGENTVAPEIVRSIAEYLPKSFKKAIERSTHGRFKVVDKPEGETFVVAIALVKLVPTQLEVNWVGNVGTLFIPGAFPIVAASSVAAPVAAHEIGKGKVAMAMKITHAGSGKVIAETYDERTDRAALIINVRDFTRWGNARMIIDDWASEFAALLQVAESTKVSAPSPISLILW